MKQHIWGIVVNFTNDRPYRARINEGYSTYEKAREILENKIKGHNVIWHTKWWVYDKDTEIEYELQDIEID